MAHHQVHVEHLPASECLIVPQSQEQQESSVPLWQLCRVPISQQLKFQNPQQKKYPKSITRKWFLDSLKESIIIVNLILISHYYATPLLNNTIDSEPHLQSIYMSQFCSKNLQSVIQVLAYLYCCMHLERSQQSNNSFSQVIVGILISSLFGFVLKGVFLRLHQIIRRLLGVILRILYLSESEPKRPPQSYTLKTRKILLVLVWNTVDLAALQQQGLYATLRLTVLNTLLFVWNQPRTKRISISLDLCCFLSISMFYWEFSLIVVIEIWWMWLTVRQDTPLYQGDVGVWQLPVVRQYS